MSEAQTIEETHIEAGAAQAAPEKADVSKADPKLRIVGGRDASVTVQAAAKEFSRLSGWQLETQVMRVAGDVVTSGLNESGKGNVHMNRMFADKAAGFERDQLAELQQHENPAIAASARLVAVWQDQMRYRDQVESAEAEGCMDLGAVEARGIMLGLARSIAPAVPTHR
jgi:hypothetical protein